MNILKLILAIISILCCYLGNAQTQKALKVYDEDDNRYREDQFYISATFNVLSNLPPDVSQSGFSGGLHAGFIRDFPINNRRNWALGLGLGYSINVYNHNLLAIPNSSGNITYEVPTDLIIDTNRFSTQLLEVPLQIRWRTSTATSYKFWRIYTGIRAGYVTRFKTNFVADSGDQFKFTNPEGINRWRMGATISVGWNTWNFHVYYSLIDFFKRGVLSDQDRQNMSAIKLGLEFFIL